MELQENVLIKDRYRLLEERGRGGIRGSMAGEGRGDGGGSGGEDIHRPGQAGVEGVHGGVQGGQRAEPSQPRM